VALELQAQINKVVKEDKTILQEHKYFTPEAVEVEFNLDPCLLHEDKVVADQELLLMAQDVLQALTD
jgi:hypothetical protein